MSNLKKTHQPKPPMDMTAIASAVAAAVAAALAPVITGGGGKAEATKPKLKISKTGEGAEATKPKAADSQAQKATGGGGKAEATKPKLKTSKAREGAEAADSQAQKAGGGAEDKIQKPVKIVVITDSSDSEQDDEVKNSAPAPAPAPAPAQLKREVTVKPHRMESNLEMLPSTFREVTGKDDSLDMELRRFWSQKPAQKKELKPKVNRVTTVFEYQVQTDPVLENELRLLKEVRTLTEKVKKASHERESNRESLVDLRKEAHEIKDQTRVKSAESLISRLEDRIHELDQILNEDDQGSCVKLLEEAKGELEKLGRVIHPDTMAFNALLESHPSGNIWGFLHQFSEIWKSLSSSAQAFKASAEKESAEKESTEKASSKKASSGKASAEKESTEKKIPRPFTFLTASTSSYYREGFSLVLQEYAVARAIIIALGKNGLFQIRDWSLNKVEFPKHVDRFPRDYDFHAYVVAMFKWLEHMLETYNKKNTENGFTMEQALSTEKNAMQVFARFLMNKANGRVCSDDKKQDRRKKGPKPETVSSEDEESDDEESDDEESEDEEFEVPEVEFKPIGLKQHVARGGCAAPCKKIIEKSAQTAGEMKTDLDGLVEEFRGHMRMQFNSSKIQRSNLGCETVISGPAFAAYQGIKSAISGGSVIDFLAEKKVIIECGDGEYTISRTSYRPSSEL